MTGEALLYAENWQLKREAGCRMKERTAEQLLAEALPDTLRLTTPKSRGEYYKKYFDATDSEPKHPSLLSLPVPPLSPSLFPSAPPLLIS
jgi:hypothetical protein